MLETSTLSHPKEFDVDNDDIISGGGNHDTSDHDCYIDGYSVAGKIARDTEVVIRLQRG